MSCRWFPCFHTVPLGKCSRYNFWQCARVDRANLSACLSSSFPGGKISEGWARMESVRKTGSDPLLYTLTFRDGFSSLSFLPSCLHFISSLLNLSNLLLCIWCPWFQSKITDLLNVYLYKARIWLFRGWKENKWSPPTSLGIIEIWCKLWLWTRLVV